MNITTRNLIILDYLQITNNSSIKDIQEKFKMSESQVRYDLKNINKVIKKHNQGEIQFLDKGKITLVSTKDIISFENSKNLKYILNNRERIEFLEIYILFNSFKFNIQRIIEKLDITRNTFKSDYSKIKQNFYKNKIILDNKGKLKISQSKIRIYLIMSLSKIVRNMVYFPQIYKYVSKFIFDNALKYVNYSDINIIINYIEAVLEDTKITLSDNSFQMLITYLIIIIENISNKNYKVSDKLRNQNFFKNTREFEILNSKKNILENKFNIKINEIEIIKLTNFFLGSYTYGKKSDFYQNWIRSEIFVEKFIRKVSKKLNCNLMEDSILFNDILNHLKPAIYRIRNNINFENSIYKEVIKKYNTLFNIVKDTITKMSIIKNIQNDEISYLTVYFALALNRKNKSYHENIKSVIIVCNLGYGTSKLLSYSLKENYNIYIKNIIPFNKISEYKDFENTDYIITTMDLRNMLINTPIIKVNPILDRQDFIKLDDLGFLRNRNKISLKEVVNLFKGEISDNKLNHIINNFKNKFSNFIIDDYIQKPTLKLNELISKDKIIVTNKEKNYKKAIFTLGKILVKNNVIKTNYIENIIGIIKSHGTYMILNNKYAIFHAKNENNVFKTSLALMVSKEPIEVEDKITNLIMILASKDGYEHINAIIEFSKIFDNEENINKIITFKDNKSIYDFIISKI